MSFSLFMSPINILFAFLPHYADGMEKSQNEEKKNDEEFRWSN